MKNNRFLLYLLCLLAQQLVHWSASLFVSTICRAFSIEILQWNVFFHDETQIEKRRKNKNFFSFYLWIIWGLNFALLM